MSDSVSAPVCGEKRDSVTASLASTDQSSVADAMMCCLGFLGCGGCCVGGGRVGRELVKDGKSRQPRAMSWDALPVHYE
jgi:hypothetical protein